MFSKRDIVLQFDEEFPVPNGAQDTLLTAAVGYLCMWAVHNDRYCRLRLYGDRRGDLHARYTNKDGVETYVIFGHRQEDGNYSFHS
jgi:hypothetical protein